MTCHWCTRRFPVPHREHLGDSARAVTETVPVVPGAAPPAVEPFEVRIDLGGLHPADVTRLLEIASTLARHGIVVVARRGPFIALRVRRRAPRALAVALRRRFVDLGPTFVTFGQLLASSPGRFPEVAAPEFRSPRTEERRVGKECD